MLNRRDVLVGASAIIGAAAVSAVARAVEPLLSGNLGDGNDLTVRGAETFEEMRGWLDGAAPVSLMTEVSGPAYCAPELIESFGSPYLARVAGLPVLFHEVSRGKLECISLTLSRETVEGCEYQRMLITYRGEAGANREIASASIGAGVDLNEVTRGLARQAAAIDLAA